MEEIDNGKNLHLLKADREKIFGGGVKAASGEREEGAGGLPGVTVESYHGLGHEMRVLKVPGKRTADSREGEGLYKEYTPQEYSTPQENSAQEHSAPQETPVTMTFVPYYAWNNRGEGEMTVWVRI